MHIFRERLFSAMWFFWLLCGIFLWVFWLTSVPRFLQRAEAGTLPTAVVNGLSPADVASEGASAWGTSVAVWSWISVVVNGLSFLIFSLVALIIWWRLRTSFGLLTAFVLLVGGSSFMNVAIYSAELSVTAIYIWEFGGIIWPIFFLWLYLFPNGQPVPRRLLWALVPILGLLTSLFLIDILTILLGDISPLAQFVSRLQPPVEVLVLALFPLVFGAQLYRYVRVSGVIEREQTKWFLFGLGIAFISTALLDILIDFLPELGTLVFVALPLGIGISVLRYHLFEIDLIIRRTLQYTLLTGLLALIYFGSVVLLQSLFENLTGGQSPIVIVISTLTIAALFNPLRLRVQDFIDRRLYRKKYDTEQTLARFAMVARDEVDMDKLTAELLVVVEDTMHPEEVSLWLRA